VNRRVLGLSVAGVAVLLLLALLTIPMLVVGGSSILFAGGSGAGCGQGSGPTVAQPGVSAQAQNSIPVNYLTWFRRVGQQYGIAWTILAGIGEVESDDGRSTLPGVLSGANPFGAAGPMQIGIGGAAGDQWGGAPIHPASEVVDGVATDEDGKPTVSVYDPADAIAGAAKYLLEHGVQTDPSEAIFAYNHLDSYVQDVLSWASTYASGGYTVSAVTPGSGSGPSGTCTGQLDVLTTPNAVVGLVISYAEAQIGKPYLWGGTGPDAFDCSGLVMMAYRAAGIDIPRTSQEQWLWGPRVPASQVEPGDLVFFAGGDGTVQAPGHVGLVIGNGQMIEAYATGFPIRISTYGTPTSPGGDNQVVGFIRPWAHAGVNLTGG
jgi:cell wall-associated NlpC family hydrolase